MAAGDSISLGAGRRHHFRRTGHVAESAAADSWFQQSTSVLKYVSQENCKVGVWSIFWQMGADFTASSSTENMDLTPLSGTLKFS